MLSLIGSPAQAAGYYTSDVGVRSFSRGGAYVAGASDLLALWYNPAALTRLSDGMVTVDAAGVWQQVSFDRKDYPGEGPLDANGDPTDLINAPIENGAPAYVIPHIGAAWDFGLPNTTFAVGFYPPYAPDLAYPEDGAQRYTLVDTLIIQTFTGASVAHRFMDRLSVGGGLSWNYLRVEQVLAVNIPANFTDPTAIEDPQYDVPFRMDGRDTSALGWNVGLLYEPPSNRYAIGFMYQAPVRFSATGEMEADFSDNFFRTDDNLGIIDTDTARDDQVRFDVSMPPIVKMGALVRPMPNLELELAAVWEGWSVIQEITLTDVNMTVPIDADKPAAAAFGIEDIQITDNIVLPAGYQDTWSVRFGGEWQIVPEATVRAGTMWEQGAIPAASRGVSLLDGDKWGVGFGGTFQPTPRWGFDVGYFQSWVPEANIENSDLKSIMLNWQTGEIIEGRNIGDGRLSGSARILGGGVTYAFGKNPAAMQKLGHEPPQGR